MKRRWIRLTCGRGLSLACLLTCSLGCARQPLTLPTVEILTPPAALLTEIAPPGLAGDTNADLARAYLECVGVVASHNADKVALKRWSAAP